MDRPSPNWFSSGTFLILKTSQNTYMIEERLEDANNILIISLTNFSGRPIANNTGMRITHTHSGQILLDCFFIKKLFTTADLYSLLCPEAAVFLKSQRLFTAGESHGSVRLAFNTFHKNLAMVSIFIMTMLSLFLKCLTDSIFLL